MELIHQSGEIIAEKYRILDILGQGSSGTTYQAENLHNGELVAIKVLSLNQLTDWKMLELFEREVKILSQLNHPRIPHYLEYFEIDRESDRSFYIVQQLAKGKSLAAWVETGWRTDEKGIRKIAIQILEILDYLHHLEPPVIHRDIKPQNIIMREDGQVFLVDFGAVQDTYHNTFMRGNTVVGTYGYMAPEQFRGQAVPTTDLYGLGATLLFLLTHRSPSDLPTDRLKINFRSRVQISEQFADWLEKILEPDVEDRFTSTKEAIKALRGKQVINNNEVRQSFPWQAIVGLGVAAVVSVNTLNYYKYALLDTFQIESPKMYVAATDGDVETIKRYLEQGGNANAKVGREILLHQAVRNQNNKMVKLLISKGADINAKNAYRYTPLYLAVEKNNKKIVELLIAKGADVNSENRYDGITPLHLAVDKNNKEMVELLIAKGADINAKNKYGDTALYGANKEVTELLIAKGANINATNNYGDTLLHYASKEVAELLIAKGLNINATNNDGDTPLHLAAKNDKTEVIELLIAKGADVNARNNDGNTPVHQAAAFNYKDLAEPIKNHGGKK